MSMLPLALIAAGYVSLVVTAGPLGFGLVLVHLVIMASASAISGPKAQRPRR